MRTICIASVFLIATCLSQVVSQKPRQALFVKKDIIENGKRVARQTSADQMVQNILQWLQEVYSQNSRRIRQGTLREYLPPVNTQKPRPFQPVTPGTQTAINGGYPPAGQTPQPPFPNEGYPPFEPPIQTPDFNGYPSSKKPVPSPTTGFPNTGYPSSVAPTNYPSTGYPSSTGTNTYPTDDFPNRSGNVGTTSSSISDNTQSVQSTYNPDTFPTAPVDVETELPFTSKSTTIIPTTPSDDDNIIPSSRSYTTTTEDHKAIETEQTTAIAPPDDDLRHPPHIHAIDVECSKEMMTINIEFNRQFDGIIYSKGHFNSPECRYVTENSGKTKYTIKVSLNSCGTEFISAFDTQGKSYLENVLVLQNEVGIQEVWDTVRSVRCLWEGNLKKSLNVALSVGMLNQEIVTFSGDTAMARLDIQLGKGPFAPPANGLVKIGEVMTLVVSVTGDPGFDIQVKDCKAKDSSGENIVALTDDRGCILKPKLFGSFQKTRDTGNTGASIIAYAFFNAFKFPDVMDLMLECNVDLCKTDCEECPDSNQKIDPERRRKRDLYSQNTTNDDSVKMGKAIRVILPEDLSDGKTVINFDHYNEGVCMSHEGFAISVSFLVLLLALSSLFSAYVWLKYQRLSFQKVGSL